MISFDPGGSSEVPFSGQGWEEKATRGRGWGDSNNGTEGKAKDCFYF